MSTAVGVCLALLGACCVASAWVLWRVQAGRFCAVLTAASGVVLLADLALRSTGTAPNLTAVAVLLGPLALAGYPRFAAGGSRSVAGGVLLLVALGGGTALLRPEWADGLGIGLAFVLIGHAWWVIERASASDRSAMLWAGSATVFVLLAGGLFGFGYAALDPAGEGSVTEAVGYLLTTLVPAAMAIGVVNPRLVDVRWLVTSVTVTLVVAVCFLAAASTLVYGVEALTGRPLNLSVVVAVCALLALAVAPTRAWLYGTFERMLFGGRPDPITALASVAGRIGDDLADALDAVRDALVVPYLKLDLPGRTPLSSGTEVPHVTRIDLDAGEGRSGALIVGLRPGERAWSRADLGVLGLVAPLLAATVRAQLMAEQVAQSRADAVTAIEDERRRLRRDLHDGVGPLLSGVVFTADAAGNLLRRDPDAAAELLQRLRRDTAKAIVEVRQLVEGLRPPALDELGLVEALRTWSGGLRAAGGDCVAVTFEGADQVRGLSAAGEAAAYRIAVEALTNVARHSGADRATVRFDRQGHQWRLQVTDPGVGGDWTPGVGLNSMRERAEAAGGRLTAGNGLVSLTLPVG